jgi:nucleoside-diphosphate-sugar epimerase
VWDVADGLLRLGLAPAAPGEPVNLATGRVMTVRAFVLEAARVLPLPPGLLRFERAVPPGESDHDAVPIGRLRALTGWQPPTPVDEGIRLTAAHEGSR